jgi:sugar/nucleoside kinase (ribokinase family)
MAKLGAARPGDEAAWTGREVWSPAFRAPEGGSATGSGDSSLAGFLTAFLLGETIETAVACGNALGFQNLHALDAISGIKDWNSAREIAADNSLERLPLDPNAEGWRFEQARNVWFGPAEEE